MIYIDMNGRCGNQFFQYAFAKKLSLLNNNMPIKIDFFHVERWKKKTGFNDYCNQLKNFNVQPISEVLENGDTLKKYGSNKQNILFRYYSKARALSFKTRTNIFANIYQKVLQKFGVFRDDEYKLKPRKCKSKDIFIRGYFEDPLYFEDMKDVLLEEFTPKYPQKEKNKQLYEIINNSESVCVSFRVWNDIKDDKNELAARDVCNIEYYEKAIKKMKEIHPNSVFIVFSNDVEWVRNNFKFPSEVYFESGDDEVWEKMRMMYSCKHFIMSTSTFCWWAQYLCRNKDKTVISPMRWTNDDKRSSKLMMEDWIKISD